MVLYIPGAILIKVCYDSPRAWTIHCLEEHIWQGKSKRLSSVGSLFSFYVFGFRWLLLELLWTGRDRSWLWLYLKTALKVHSTARFSHSNEPAKSQLVGKRLHNLKYHNGKWIYAEIFEVIIVAFRSGIEGPTPTPMGTTPNHL